MRNSILVLVMLVVCCGFNALALTGDQIASHALNFDNQCCWSCKEFVKKVLVDLGQPLGSGYRDCYLSIATEILDPSAVAVGDIGQVSCDSNPEDETNVHSFIVLRNEGGNNMMVVHSNWCDECYTVSVETKNFHDWANKYPGWSVHYYRLKAINVGNYGTGVFFQPIYDCFVQRGGFSQVGHPYDDGAGIYVHNWLPYSYLCQNFVNDKGQQSVIMYNPNASGQAYLVSSLTWEMYRHGYLGRYGPDIILPNGKRLGGPISNEWAGIQRFENGYYVFGKFTSSTPKANSLKSAGSLKAATNYSVTVELHQLDGLLVEAFCPDGEISALTIVGHPVSEQQTLIKYLGGPACDYYSVLVDDVEIGQTTSLEFTETGLSPGTSRTYQVKAMSFTSGELATSNSLTIITPGQPGSFTIQGMADNASSTFIQWQDTLYSAQYFALYRDGVKIAKISGNAFSDFPLEPSTVYRYQVAATTFSGLVLGFTNEVLVTTPPTEQPPTLPDPFPTRISITLSQSLWAYATSTDTTGTYLSGQVFDQYDQVMPNVSLVFVSSNPAVFTVSAQSGWCVANGLGQAQVWAQVYDWSGIQSERLEVTVVDQLPSSPLEPDTYPLADQVLAQEIEILAAPPYLQYQNFYYAVTLTNPTSETLTWYRLQLYHFDLNGQMVADSPSSGTAKTLAPGETKRFVESGGQFQASGTYYTQVMINLDNTANGQRYVVNQTADGISPKKYYHSYALTELQPDLQILGLDLPQGEIKAGQEVEVLASIINRGDAPANAFTVTLGIRAQETQACEIDSLAVGQVKSCCLIFPALSVGSYALDLFLDATSLVPETNEANNTATRILTVTKEILPPVITQDPKSQTVFTKGKAIFSVVASRAKPPDDPSDDPLSYQWQKDEQNIEGATQSTLTLTNVGFDQTGSYACVVRTAQGQSAISQKATLTVKQRLTILQAPKTQTLTQGQEYLNTVLAIGEGDLHFQWYKDSQAIAGACSNSLSISAVNFSDAGWYTCLVTDSNLPKAQKLTTKAVELAVRSNDLGQPILDLVYHDGDSFLTATIDPKQTALANLLSSPTAIPTQKTYADITNLGLRFMQRITPVNCWAEAQTISVPKTGPSSPASMYDGTGIDGNGNPVSLIIHRLLNCQVMAYLKISGKMYYLNLSTIQIRLNGQPLVVTANRARLYLAMVKPQLTITSDPASKIAKTGQNVKFVVTAQGDPVLTYQWQKDGQDICGATRSYLTLLNVQKTNNGVYACVVKSGADARLVSGGATLVVYTKLTIIKPPESQDVFEENDVTLSVEALGEGALSYQWYKDGQAISQAKQSSLLIPAIKVASQGEYYCRVIDSCPQTAQRIYSPKATLKVLPKLTATVCAQVLSQGNSNDCPENMAVNPGKTVQFTCQPSGGLAPYAFQWYQDGQVIVGENQAVMVRSNVQEADEGVYTCIVSDGA